METRKKTLTGLKNKKETSKKISKAGQWMRNNKGGIATVVDWKAVNK